jgi:hypothetical protein
MKRILALFVVICGLMFSCKKSADQPSDNVVGQWRWVYSAGGVGVIRRPAVGDKETIMTLNADSTYSFAEADVPYDQGKFQTGITTDAVSKEKLHSITFRPSRDKASAFTNYVVVKNDSLHLSPTFSWEGSHIVYVRKK